MIGSLILQDCVEFYNLLSNLITNVIELIFEMDDETALVLDELYSDLIQLTTPMQNFDKIRDMMIDIGVTRPQIYKLDPIFNKKEEIYIHNIKKSAEAQGKKLLSHRIVQTGKPELSQNYSQSSEIKSKRLETKKLELKLIQKKDDYFALDNQSEVSDLTPHSIITQREDDDSEVKLYGQGNSPSQEKENMLVILKKRKDINRFKEEQLVSDISLKDLTISGLQRANSIYANNDTEQSMVFKTEQGRSYNDMDDLIQNQGMEQNIMMSNFYLNSKKKIAH